MVAADELAVALDQDVIVLLSVAFALCALAVQWQIIRSMRAHGMHSAGTTPETATGAA
jgi:hypothetical protein